MLKLPGLDLDSSQTEALTQALVECQSRPSYVYPWQELSADLERGVALDLPLVGYGSLVNLRSASLTLGESTLATARPVLAVGIRRVFDYVIPPSIDRYAAPPEPHAIAALNVRLTHQVGDVANGVLLHIPPAEIPTLLRREVGYDLIPVPYLEWPLRGEPPCFAYILSSPKGGPRTRQDIVPNPDYYAVCRRGASEVDDDFKRLWLATTYLADGVTAMSVWEEGQASRAAR